MANTRVRQIHEFISVSGAGKKQSAHGVYMPNGDIDTREKCRVEISDNVNRRDEFDCDGQDLLRQAILDRDTQVTLTYDDGFTPQQAARWIAYKESVAASPSGSTVNEVQTLTPTGTVSGGTFTISLTHEGKTGTTEAIAFDANNATILAALLKKTGTSTAMGKLLKSGDVSLGGTIATALTITFTGRFAGTNVAMVVVDDAAITGGGTIEESQTTAGSQLSHAITRSTDGTLAEFSFITGDKNDTFDDFKYGDAVVESVNFTMEQGAGALVQMTVVIYCNYTAERESAYSAPTCVNITPLKVEDCKVSIDGTFETPDVASLSFTSSNNIPREAAFAYDDIDISNAYQRGDIPSQNFTASIYGIPSTTLYTLAEAEETDGNNVAFILYLGRTANRLAITPPNAKIRFHATRLGYAGALRQSTINIEAIPLQSPPLTYVASIAQAGAFLVASS